MFHAMKPFRVFDKDFETGDTVKPADVGPYLSNLLADGFISPDAPESKKKALKESTPDK